MFGGCITDVLPGGAVGVVLLLDAVGLDVLDVVLLGGAVGVVLLLDAVGIVPLDVAVLLVRLVASPATRVPNKERSMCVAASLSSLPE